MNMTERLLSLMCRKPQQRPAIAALVAMNRFAWVNQHFSAPRKIAPLCATKRNPVVASDATATPSGNALAIL